MMVNGKRNIREIIQNPFKDHLFPGKLYKNIGTSWRPNPPQIYMFLGYTLHGQYDHPVIYFLDEKGEIVANHPKKYPVKTHWIRVL